MPLAKPLEHALRRLEPLGRHPGDVRHHARPLLRVAVLVRRLGSQPGELGLDVGDRDAGARPLLYVGDGTHQVPPPRAAVAVEQVVGRRRPPGPRRVVREGRAVPLPAGDDGVHDRPLLLDLVRAREQRCVAEHRVEDQPLVGLRQAVTEGAPVQEVHMHRPDGHALPWHLGADCEGQTLIGLHVDQEHVRPEPLDRDLLERRMRRPLELDRDRRLAPRQPLPHPDVEGRVGPAPVVDVEL